MSLTNLPDDLPVPTDNGETDHLQGLEFPEAVFSSTNDNCVELCKLKGLVVLYVYPMTGRPDTELPDGWDSIPGARGCTPQSCSFRDHYSELRHLNAEVFGLSTQTTDYQREASERLHLPFALLSDDKLALKIKLALPTFVVDNMELYQRLTLILHDGIIKKVFYPVFPPDRNADDVLNWLHSSTV